MDDEIATVHRSSGQLFAISPGNTVRYDAQFDLKCSPLPPCLCLPLFSLFFPFSYFIVCSWNPGYLVLGLDWVLHSFRVSIHTCDFVLLITFVIFNYMSGYGYFWFANENLFVHFSTFL